MKILFPKKNILHKPFLFSIVLFLFSYCQAQLFPVKNYPKGYFMYPVDARISIAANFGELRPNHYHMGLDCRTNQVQNRRVKAAADGYVAHIRVEPFGFGRAIYINHPNGLTTVYGRSFTRCFRRLASRWRSRAGGFASLPLSPWRLNQYRRVRDSRSDVALPDRVFTGTEDATHRRKHLLRDARVAVEIAIQP